METLEKTKRESTIEERLYQLLIDSKISDECIKTTEKLFYEIYSNKKFYINDIVINFDLEINKSGYIEIINSLEVSFKEKHTIYHMILNENFYYKLDVTTNEDYKIYNVNCHIYKMGNFIMQIYKNLVEAKFNQYLNEVDVSLLMTKLKGLTI